MNFNKHLNLEGKHAVLGASKYQWLNYDSDTLMSRIGSHYASEVGTILHDIAKDRIKYRFKLAKSDKKNVILELLKRGTPSFIFDIYDFDAMYDNLMLYVNDAIGFKMQPEVVLCYSEYCFGTTDAIHFQSDKHLLRIHDYKSGITPAHMEQLEIYAALFCLEYKYGPSEIDTELRIYQYGDYVVMNPTAEDITPIMDKIVTFNKFITKLKAEEES